MMNHLKSMHKGVSIGTKGKLKGAQAIPVKQSQPKIQQSFAMATARVPVPLTEGEKEGLRRSLAWMTAVDIRPISMVDGIGFRNFCRKMNPQFTLPARKTVNLYLSQIYQEGKDALIADISGGSVGLTTDLWTSHANEGYITITSQFINPKWVQSTKVLATRVMLARHTGVDIANEIRSVMAEFGIMNVMAICTDNASNMKVACQEADFQRIPCFAHTLQLAINDGLRLGKPATEAQNGTIMKALARARKLVGFFNRSTPGKHYH